MLIVDAYLQARAQNTGGLGMIESESGWNMLLPITFFTNSGIFFQENFNDFIVYFSLYHF